MVGKTGGNRGDVRKSALWGSGNRGGEFRANALGGKGGRGLVTAIAVLALALPLAATAAPGRDRPGAPANGDVSYVSKKLKDRAKGTPDALVSIIVQVDPSASGSARAARHP